MTLATKTTTLVACYAPISSASERELKVKAGSFVALVKSLEALREVCGDGRLHLDQPAVPGHVGGLLCRRDDSSSGQLFRGKFHPPLHNVPLY